MGIPFECDLCHFRNMVERDPVEGDDKDEFTPVCTSGKFGYNVEP